MAEMGLVSGSLLGTMSVPVLGVVSETFLGKEPVPELGFLSGYLLWTVSGAELRAVSRP